MRASPCTGPRQNGGGMRCSTRLRNARPWNAWSGENDPARAQSAEFGPLPTQGAGGTGETGAAGGCALFERGFMSPAAFVRRRGDSGLIVPLVVGAHRSVPPDKRVRELYLSDLPWMARIASGRQSRQISRLAEIAGRVLHETRGWNRRALIWRSIEGT